MSAAKLLSRQFRAIVSGYRAGRALKAQVALQVSGDRPRSVAVSIRQVSDYAKGVFVAFK
jgi:hypothetical protein